MVSFWVNAHWIGIFFFLTIQIIIKLEKFRVRRTKDIVMILSSRFDFSSQTHFTYNFIGIFYAFLSTASKLHIFTALVRNCTLYEREFVEQARFMAIHSSFFSCTHTVPRYWLAIPLLVLRNRFLGAPIKLHCKKRRQKGEYYGLIVIRLFLVYVHVEYRPIMSMS